MTRHPGHCLRLRRLEYRTQELWYYRGITYRIGHSRLRGRRSAGRLRGHRRAPLRRSVSLCTCVSVSVFIGLSPTLAVRWRRRQNVGSRTIGVDFARPADFARGRDGADAARWAAEPMRAIDLGNRPDLLPMSSQLTCAPVVETLQRDEARLQTRHVCGVIFFRALASVAFKKPRSRQPASHHCRRPHVLRKGDCPGTPSPRLATPS